MACFIMIYNIKVGFYIQIDDPFISFVQIV